MDTEFDTASFVETLNYQNNQSAADAKLRIVFEEQEVEDKEASNKAGRPIFRTVHVGSIYIPGDKDNVVTFRADKMNPEERHRFGARYDAWKANKTNKVEGTLLLECGGLMSRSRAREWEALHVLTVEQLSELSDANLQNVQGGLLERQKAKDFLALAAGRAPLTEARALIAKLEAQNKALVEQNEKLSRILDERTDPNIKKGR